MIRSLLNSVTRSVPAHSPSFVANSCIPWIVALISVALGLPLRPRKRFANKQCSMRSQHNMYVSAPLTSAVQIWFNDCLIDHSDFRTSELCAAALHPPMMTFADCSRHVLYLSTRFRLTAPYDANSAFRYLAPRDIIVQWLTERGH